MDWAKWIFVACMVIYVLLVGLVFLGVMAGGYSDGNALRGAAMALTTLSDLFIWPLIEDGTNRFRIPLSAGSSVLFHLGLFITGRWLFKKRAENSKP
ncbi:MAG: hypothetical protein HRU11_08135 [Parvularculaceae bacterium]|nr:hypothetical protein [Parvularculaceae bacterium]